MAVTENHENISVDASMILEKSWSPLVLVMNLTAGKAWMREPTARDHGFLVGRLGASHDLGRSISLSLESEWYLSHGEYFEHHPDELRAGPSVIWNGNQLWALAGLLFDLRGESDLQGPALQLQAGLPF